MDSKHTSARTPVWWSPSAWRQAQEARGATAASAPTARQNDRGALRRLPGLLGSRKDRALRWFLGLPRSLATAFVVFALVACALAGSLTYAGVSRLYANSFARYQADLAIASDASRHLQVAEADLQALMKQNPLDTTRINQAHDEMQAANADFVRLSGDLATIPGVVALLPKYGALLTAAQRLVPIALDATRAGMLGLSDWGIVASRLHDPFDQTAAGLTADDIKTLQRDAPVLVSSFDDAVARLQMLQPSDLQVDLRLGPGLATLRASLPQIQSAAQTYMTLIGQAPTLVGVGQPANYLVEILDSTELRPGGGFIGNFGILTLTGGRMTSLKVEDVDLLDAPYRSGAGPYDIPLPSQYSWFNADTRWGFRDSNLDADFPTSAKNGEQLYAREGGTTQLQGVIAITPWFFESLLKITGPVSVPEFGDTVTADNVIDKIHYHQLTSSGANSPGDNPDTNGTSFRKRFTADLFDHFLAQVKAQSSSDLGPIAHVLVDAMRTKDVQIYLNSASAEQVLTQHALADTIAAPSSGDSLFVVEANTAAIKANNWLTYQYGDSVTLDALGTATHHLTLAVTWPSNPASLTLTYPAGPPGLYYGYLRVYVPPNAHLLQQSGWKAHPAISAFGRQVWGGDWSIQYGKTSTLALTWTAPAAATQDGTGWHYHFLVQKQAGIAYPLHLAVTYPSCTQGGAAPAGFKASGKSVTATLPLDGDTTTDLSFTLSANACS